MLASTELVSDLVLIALGLLSFFLLRRGLVNAVVLLLALLL